MALAALLLVFTSCQNDDPKEVITEIDALALESDASAETTYEEIDQIVEIGFAVAETNAREDQNALGSCAVVTKDTENKTITVDFGDGCVGRHDNTLAGKIVITYTDRLYVPGATRTITFVDFYVNDIKVEGTRTVTNTSADESERQFTVTLVGGKLDFGDGNFVTRDASWTRTWFIGTGIVTRYGSASGINIDGFDYSVTVSSETPITFNRECGVGMPVSGIKVLTVGDREAIIDFGDGTCDRSLAVTVNGETFERTITPQEGKRRGNNS